MSAKIGCERKKRLACAHRSNLFCFFFLYKFICILLSHVRASRFFRQLVERSLGSGMGQWQGARSGRSLKPLFPRYLIGAYAWRCSGA